MAVPKVLIVDDDPDILSSLEGLVRIMPEEIEVFTAVNGADALAILDEHTVDVILTDYRMPHMNGIELLEAARGRYPKGAILITAYREDAQANLAARQGIIRRYMGKPGDPTKLQEMVRELLFPGRMVGT